MLADEGNGIYLCCNSLAIQQGVVSRVFHVNVVQHEGFNRAKVHASDGNFNPGLLLDLLSDIVHQPRLEKWGREHDVEEE